jgi:hypothetical protein
MPAHRKAFGEQCLTLDDGQTVRYLEAPPAIAADESRASHPSAPPHS